jgi:hypothetical protein
VEDVYKIVKSRDLHFESDGLVYAKTNTIPKIDSILSKISSDFGVVYQSASENLCKNIDESPFCLIGFYSSEKDSLIDFAYVDKWHMSRMGSVELVNLLMEQ